MLSYFSSKQISLAATACFATAASIYILWGPSQRQKRDRKGKCPGLVNLGNSCFLNAVLQALATCPSLNRWLSTVLLKCGDGHQSKVLIPALQSVLKVLNNAEDSTVYSEEFCPTEVLEALQARRWVISSDQQDAHELFHVLTETLDEESTKYPSVISLLDIVQLLESEHQDKCVAVNSMQTELPLLPARDTDSPFRGLLASQLQCTRCSYKYPVKYDTFDSLSLTLPPTAIPMLGGLSIEELLERFVRPESVYDVECTGCAKHMKRKDGAPLPKATFVKKLTIGKLPQCLCIHIQRTVWRSDGLPMKRRDFVKFSDSLDMGPYIYHKRKPRPQTLNLGTLPGLLGGKSPTSTSPSPADKDKRKCGLSSPCVQIPYPYPLNFLKALHYSQLQSPQRGLYLDPMLYNTSGPQNQDIDHLQYSYKQQQQENCSLAQSTGLHQMDTSLAKKSDESDTSLALENAVSLDKQRSSLAVPKNEIKGSDQTSTDPRKIVSLGQIKYHQPGTSSAHVESLDRMARSYSFEQVFESEARASNKYRLCAVVEHRGDVFSGHFVTYRQGVQTTGDSNQGKMSNRANLMTKWLYTSDTTVKWVKFGTVMAVDAYMLFYEKT